MKWAVGAWRWVAGQAEKVGPQIGRYQSDGRQGLVLGSTWPGRAVVAKTTPLIVADRPWPPTFGEGLA